MNVVVQQPTLAVTKLTPNMGVEITGIDLNKPLDSATRQRLIDALHEHIFIVVRDQHFTPDQFIAAGRLFGKLQEQDQPEIYGLPGYPEIRQVSNMHKDKSGNIAKYSPEWHTDHTHYTIPPKYTALYPVTLPTDTIGGGTSFCNTRLGYARLPDDLKQKITPMKTVNVLAGSAARNAKSTSVEGMQAGNKNTAIQPLVRTHPDHGSKAVYFHPKKTENVIGMTPEDTQDMLDDLMVRMVQPDTTYTHQWRMGDFLMWDNRSSLHKAGNNYDKSQLRLFYRIIVEGEKPM